MIKKNIQCVDCEKFSSIFIKYGDEMNCAHCNSANVKVIYKPLKFDNKVDINTSTGELSQEYIDENKFVLEEMKKEKMLWNS